MNFNKRTYQLILSITTLIVFSPTFFNDFQLSWDDQWQLLNNPFVEDVSLDNLIYHFGNFYHGQYSPVNTLIYILTVKLFGLNALAFHALCLIIHCINSLLAYSLIYILLGNFKPLWDENRKLLFSFLTSLIFAIHPLQVESVAWISASKVVLYTLFFLAGFLFYIRYIETNRFRWLIATAVCYLLSFGTKEQAIIFPLNLLLFDWAFGRFREISFSVKWLKSQVVIEKIPFIILALFFWWFSAQNSLGDFSGAEYPMHQRLVFTSSSLMDYVFRFLAPVKLYYFYFFPIEAGDKLPLFYFSYPVLVALSIWFAYTNYRLKNGAVVFGILFFVANLLLALHIVPLPRKMITADRFMYLSMLGAAITTVWLAFYLLTKYRKWKSFLFAGMTIWVIFLAAHSFYRTMQWKDSDSVKQNIKELVEKRKAQNKPTVNNPLLEKNGK